MDYRLPRGVLVYDSELREPCKPRPVDDFETFQADLSAGTGMYFMGWVTNFI